MRIFIPLSLFAVLVFASEDGSNETLNDVEPETTKKFIHGEGGQDTTDSSGTIDLSRIDIVSPINMGLIKGGLNIKIPKDNYVMIPYMGVRISASSNFFPIYTSKVGECVTFTEDAQFDVVFDSKGCPMIVDGQGNIFSGYREDNGRIINGNPNDQFVTKKFDQSTIIAECENLGPRFIGYYTIPGHSFTISNAQPQGNNKYGLGFDFKNFDASAANLGRISPAIFNNYNIPAGYLMMTDLGVKFLQSSNEYWPVFYETVTGDLKSFNQDGDIIKVFVDESGCPLTIDDDGLIIPGYKLKGGVEYEASTKTVVLEKPHLNVRDILAKINSVGRSNPAFWLLHAQKGYSVSNKEAITPTAQFGIGINFGNLNLQGSLGMGLINVNNLGYIPKGYVIVPGMGVKVSTQGSYKPVIVNKWGEAFAISDYGSDLLNVYFDPSSIPVTQGNYGNFFDGYREIDGKYYGANKKRKCVRQKLDTNKITQEVIQLGPHFPGYYTLFPISSSHSIGVPRDQNPPLNLGKLKVPNLKRSRNRGGLQVDIPFGYIALPNSGVRLARGGAYFNVYADRGGNLCVFDDNGDKISVHLDEKGIPCVIGKSGNIYGGYKLVNGRNVEANLASKLRTKVVDISVVTTEIEEMGSCYEEYYTLHRPQMNSVNSLFTSNMHHLETGRPQSVNYEIFTQIKTATKINIASMYNFKGVNLGKIDQKSFNVPIPKNYVMIPHVGVRLSAYSQSYFPIYISPYNSQTVAFNQDGEEVVVEWDENGNPLALGENNMRFAGYREINNVYKYAKVSQKTYKPRVFNYDQVVQEVESLGPKCINYLTIHNPKVNITINHNYGPTKKPKTAKTTPIQMRGRPGVVTVTEATTTTTTTTTTPRPIINLNTLLRVNYMYVDVINCFGNITGGLPCRSPNRNFVAIPGMGVSFCDDYVYHPIYLNIESLEVIGLHNNLEVPILFDTDSGAPVSYDSASNTYWPGFIMIDGKMVFSTPPKGNYLTMKIDAEIILSKIEELGKSYPGYYTKHQRRNLRDTLEEILKGLTVTSSLQYITPLAFDLPICNETRYTMLPGFGCQINADSEYYPIYLDDKGRAYVFNLEGSSLEVFFDGEGAPLIFSSDGRTTHSGFFIKNGVPEFSANGGEFERYSLDLDLVIKYIDILGCKHPAYYTIHDRVDLNTILNDILSSNDISSACGLITAGHDYQIPHGYIVVIGMSVRIDQTKRYWNPVFVNKHGALVAIDSSGNVINLVTDSQGIPVIKKGILLEGRISRNGVIETSATYSRTYVPKIDVEIVKTHLTRMGPNFIFYNNLYPRVDISSILQEILDKLTLETAVCSLINTGIDGNKLERRGYYALPGFGISADGTENYSPIFVTQGGSIVTFDHLTDQLIQVVLDHHGMPAVIDSATSEIRKGFAIIEGKPKYALSEGKFVNSKVDVNIVIKTIERLGYECPYYLSVFPAIELSSILPNIFLSLTPENAALYIEDDFELPPDSKYVLVPGIGTKTRDSGEKFRHCYVDDKGLLFSFDANKEPVEVYQDIFGVVFTKYETKVYEGFILLNQKQKLSITVGKVRIPIIDRNQVVACNNRLGVNFMKGYSSCNKKIDIASILPEILNSLDATLAHGAINAGLYENVPMEYYALGGFGIKYEVNSTTKIYPIYCHQGKLVLVDEQSTVYECLQDIQGAPLVEIDGTFHRGYYEYLGKRVFATIGGKFNSIQVETNIVINSLLKIGPNYFGWLTVKRPLNLLEDFEKIMGALTLENSIAQIEYEETPVPSGYIQLPGFAVKTTPNGKFTPVYVDKSGYLKAFNEEGTPIKVVFDCQNIPISISECNTILQGFVIIDGSHRYSVTSGKTKQIELNLAIIIETIDRLGPDHPAYLSLHPPIDLKDLEDIMDSMTLENSMRLINPVGLTVHIPSNMYCMIPGMGVALDNSKNYYPIWIDKQTRKCVVFSNEGLIQTINFDEGGVPVVNTISIDGSEQVYGGFVVYKNKTRFSTKFSKFRDITLSYDPIFKACNRLGPSYHGFKYLYPEIPVQNELGRILEALNVRSAQGLVNSGIAHNVPKNYYLIPGFGTTIEENSKNIYPLYINEDDESVCTFVDSESPPIDVWFDLQNLPRVENDIGTFAGYMEYNNEPRHSLIIGDSKRLTLNLTIVLDAIDRIGPMFESGFLTLHRPVEIETRFGEIMDALDINSAIGLITAGLNYKPQNDLYLMVPGMATRITSSGEYFPIYINSKSLDLVAFDRDSTIIQVKFDIQNVPCVTLNEGSQIPGYIYTFGVIRHGVTSSRIRQITLDIEIIKRTIIRLGYSYPGFSSMFPLPNLKLLLSPTYASLTLDKSMGLINAGLAIELHDLSVKKWLAVPAMGVNLNSKKNKFYPIYTDCDGNLHSFNESLHSFRVLISDDGSPVAMSPTNEIYLGFIVINDEEIMSTGVGRLSSVTIDYSFVLDAINFLGPRYTFYILAHPNGVASGTHPEFVSPFQFVGDSTVEYILRSSYNFGSSKQSQLKYTMTLEVPAGFAAVEGLYCMVCSDKIYYPVVINKNSKAFAINTMNEMFELLFDAENGAPVHIARNNEKYFGYRVIDGAKLYATAKSKLKSKTFDVNKYFHGSLVENEDFKFAIPDGFKQLKNYMVSVNADRVFYPVLIETNTGKPYAFDVKNQMYPVLVDTSGVPVVMGPDGTIFPGMIENAGNPIFSSTSSDETYVSKTFPTPSKR